MCLRQRNVFLKSSWMSSINFIRMSFLSSSIKSQVMHNLHNSYKWFRRLLQSELYQLQKQVPLIWLILNQCSGSKVCDLLCNRGDHPAVPFSMSWCEYVQKLRVSGRKLQPKCVCHECTPNWCKLLENVDCSFIFPSHVGVHHHRLHACGDPHCSSQPWVALTECCCFLTLLSQREAILESEAAVSC